MFNFQKAKGNTANNVMFYVNCSIYAEELAKIQSGEILIVPLEINCQFRVRVEQIVQSAPARFSITPDTNMEDLRETLLGALEEVILFYDKMTSARSIVDYYTAVPALFLSEESFHLLFKSDDAAAAKQYLKALQGKYGAEKRWTIFENKYKAVFNQYGVEYVGI